MAPKFAPEHGRFGRRQRWLLAGGVVLFLLIDVALVGFALTRDASPDPGATAGPIPTFGSVPSPSPTPTASEVPVEPVIQAAPRFMVAASATIGWRASAGSCGGESAIVEYTDDSGATWRTVSPPEIMEVMRLTSSDESSVRLIGRSGPGCSVEALASFTSGEFWSSYPDTLNDDALLDPADRATVRTSSGTVPGPCAAVRDVQERGDAIAAACDTQLFEKPDLASPWTGVAIVGLLAITPSDAGYSLAVGGAPECTGISILSLTSPVGVDAPTTLGCVPGVVPDRVTLAQNGPNIWVWNGGDVFVSSDGGATWG